MLTLDEFFAGWEQSRRLFHALMPVIETLGAVDQRVTRSQVAFRRRRAFAWVWIPARYLRGKTAPLVLTVSLPERDRSRRWKEIIAAAPGRFTHHLELWAPGDIDSEVHTWLLAAWQHAG